MKDAVLVSIGEWGRWQALLAVLLALLKLPVGWYQLSIIFLEAPMKFWCANSTQNSTDVCWESIEEDNRTLEKPCEKWEFDRGTFEETIVSEWQLVCSQSSLSDVTQSTFMLGILVGNIFFGWAADKFGRRAPLMACLVLQVSAGVAASLVPWFWVFVACRFLLAMATGGSMIIGFVLAMELVGDRWRATVSVAYHMPFSLGISFMALVATQLRHWRDLHLALSVITGAFLVYWFVVPESPRWLLAVGRKEEAARVLRRGARWNRRRLSVVTEAVQLHRGSEAQGRKEGLLQQVATRELRKTFAVLTVNWFAVGLAYFGMSQVIGRIGGNIFINTFVSGFVGLPSMLLAVFAARWSRKKTILICQAITVVSCFLLLAVPKGTFPLDWPRLALAGLSVSAMNIHFPVIYLYSGELFPTRVRNMCVGWCSMCARVGSALAPFVKSLDVYGDAYVMVTFGGSILMGFATLLLLPDTQGRTLDDAPPPKTPIVKVSAEPINTSYTKVPQDETQAVDAERKSP